MCAGRVRSDALRQRVQEAVGAALAAETQYRDRAQAASLSDYPQTDGLAELTLLEVGWLYGAQMADRRGGARSIYSAIRSAPANGRCPLCGFGTVSTLDHHLPKALYADVALSPLNLVPSCADCNKSKRAQWPATPADETLHPYFDDFSDVLWLKGTVVEAEPAAITFYVWGEEVGPVDAARLRRHMEVFALYRSFSENAAEEMTQIRRSLQGLWDVGGEVAVHAFLEEQAESRSSAVLNSWQAAAYEALSQSDWFCDGGFAIRG